MNGKDAFRYYRIICLFLVACLLVMVGLIRPINVPFWQFTVGDVINLLIALLLTSLFIERATEVVIITWRGKGKQAFVNELMSARKTGELKDQEREELVKLSQETVKILDSAGGSKLGKEGVKAVAAATATLRKGNEIVRQVAEAGQSELSATKALENYRADTKNRAMLIGFLLGLIAAMVGMRALQPLVDPAVFKTLTPVQRGWFITADAFITGAMLGGGSEGMHRIIDSFLSKVEEYRKKVKEGLMK